MEIKKQAIEIHDEVMPFMEDLRKVRKQLMAEADSLISSDSIKAVAFNEAAAAISTANEGMMQWMRDFEPEFDGTDEEAIQYFKDQKVAIEKVKEDMLGSFEKGKGLLEVQ
ncbi:MAG: hypothetical protein AAFY41_17960 [Bacteroidota bacterium]